MTLSVAAQLLAALLTVVGLVVAGPSAFGYMLGRTFRRRRRQPSPATAAGSYGRLTGLFGRSTPDSTFPIQEQVDSLRSELSELRRQHQELGQQMDQRITELGGRIKDHAEKAERRELEVLGIDARGFPLAAFGVVASVVASTLGDPGACVGLVLVILGGFATVHAAPHAIAELRNGYRTGRTPR